MRFILIRHFEFIHIGMNGVTELFLRWLIKKTVCERDKERERERENTDAL